MRLGSGEGVQTRERARVRASESERARYKGFRRWESSRAGEFTNWGVEEMGRIQDGELRRWGA